ncbi:hypothetical protein BGZ65_000884, partial [Modicella reniformis]
MFRSTVSPSLSKLLPQKALDLTNVYLENARKVKDPNNALELCDNAEASLSRVMEMALNPPKNTQDQTLREEVASACFELGQLQDHLGANRKSQISFKNAEKLGWHALNLSQLSTPPSDPNNNDNSNMHPTDVQKSSARDTTAIEQGLDIATIPVHIFSENKPPPTTVVFDLPEPDGRLNSTPQLARCLGLLQVHLSPDDIQDTTTRSWIQAIKNDTDEQERLTSLATAIIRELKRDELNDTKTVAEVVLLASVLERDDFRYLLRLFYVGIEQSNLLDVNQLEGLAQLIQNASPGYLDSDDLVKILDLLSARLRDTHSQSSHHIYQLTFSVSHVLDAMTDAKVTGLDRERLHAPLSAYLDKLKGSSDPYLVYQATYAFQALLCVPDNETLWQATFRRTGKVIQGVSGL